MIVEINNKLIKLKKQGKNFTACCPFHDEKTPSLVINPKKETYHCYGCGVSGELKNMDNTKNVIDSAFNIAYGSEKEVFSENEFAIMRVVFEAGWRMSKLNRFKK